MASSAERLLAAEWLGIMSIQTFDALSNSTGGKLNLPDPSRYFATMVVFLFLAAGAMFGDKAGRLAGAFGGVAALAIALAPGKNGKSPIVGALGYFSQLLKQPPSVATGPNAPRLNDTQFTTTASTPAANLGPTSAVGGLGTTGV